MIFVHVAAVTPQIEPKEADTLGSTLLKIDNHALISYTPTAADKAFKDKLRGSRDRRGVRERDRDAELRSPRASKRDDRSEDKDKKSEDKDRRSDEKEKESEVKDSKQGADGQDKEVGLPTLCLRHYT